MLCRMANPTRSHPTPPQPLGATHVQRHVLRHDVQYWHPKPASPIPWYPTPFPSPSQTHVQRHVLRHDVADLVAHALAHEVAVGGDHHQRRHGGGGQRDEHQAHRPHARAWEGGDGGVARRWRERKRGKRRASRRIDRGGEAGAASVGDREAGGGFDLQTTSCSQHVWGDRTADRFRHGRATACHGNS